MNGEVAPTGECNEDDNVTFPIYAEKIVSELIETERTYVSELQQIVEVRARLVVVCLECGVGLVE